MNESAEEVRRHYEPETGNADLVAKVIQILNGFGDGHLTASQLAAFDQFHILGLAATKELADVARIQKTTRVLDAGSGLGGPSRYLAETYGCTVSGVDLTPSFVEIAKLVTARTNLGPWLNYQVGDLLSLPFADAEFDVVWTQHVVMNISDRARVYREFRRVLRPNGKLAFFDLVASDEKQALIFPVPWAETPAASFLLNRVETIQALEQAGFGPGQWIDMTERTAKAFAAGEVPTPKPGEPTLAMVMGPRFREMFGNLLENFRQGRVRVAMGCYEVQ
jgi:sarcosine/dimethylglycine N-methyltransferase